MDAKRPVRPKQKTSAQGKVGHPGQKDVVDAKEPVDPRTNQEVTRVTRKKSKSQK
ncbi:hypothetical protein KI387_041336, partial [Taxus chinensis]